MEFCYLIIQPHSFNSRQRDRQVSSMLIILKLSYFGKNNPWKIEVLQVFGLCDQKIDLWFTNNKPLIPTLQPKLNEKFTPFLQCIPSFEATS